MEQETVEAFHMSGKSHDCGSKMGYMKANVEYCLRHPEWADDFKEYLEEQDIYFINDVINNIASQRPIAMPIETQMSTAAPCNSDVNSCTM